MEDYEVRAYSPCLFPPPSPFFLFLFFLPLFFSRFTVGFPQDPPSVPSTPQLRRKNCNLRADFVSIPIITDLAGPESSQDSMWASSIHQITFPWKKDCSPGRAEEREFVELRSIILKLGNSRASRRRYEGRGTFPSRFGHFLASKTNAISRRTRCSPYRIDILRTTLFHLCIDRREKNGKGEKDQDAFSSTMAVNNRNALLGLLCPHVKWTVPTRLRYPWPAT